ncbi:het-s domain-containing [Fusarium longipes]|uniref:Het-s domain-containing n=1 Tax=Fusarium longipes TaxID=694270 RepID=A0A395SJM3_9HYPO|nr:het-s domain-containing [Fusarium longipes]
MAEVAGLALGIAGIAGTIDVCIKCGKYLVQACKDYDQTDAIINELCVRIEICWSRIASQLEIVKELEHGLNEDDQKLQTRILRILRSKLEAAIAAISKSEKYGSSKRVKALHFLSLRETLESTVADLESWQQRFEPSWFQVIKTAPPAVDQVLQNSPKVGGRNREEPAYEGLKFRQAFGENRSDLLAEKVLATLETEPILHCNAVFATKKEDNKRFILDSVSSTNVTLRDARQLASRLRDSNPFTFGTLKCRGIVRLPKKESLVFVFRLPEGYDKVQSCRQLLLSGYMPHSLTMRLKIARQLVTAVYYIHLYEFVHKSITPETILLLGQSEQTNNDLVVCLVGFQLLRHVETPTNTSKANQKDSVYQHPSRASGAGTTFVMQHDIYSLGVCLLEIGLWQSIVHYDSGNPEISSNLQDLNPEAIKEQLVFLSRSELRVTMGDIYSKVVETCLTCLDEGNTEFGDPRDFEDDFGVEVGSRYIKKIVEVMSVINY